MKFLSFLTVACALFIVHGKFILESEKAVKYLSQKRANSNEDKPIPRNDFSFGSGDTSINSRVALLRIFFGNYNIHTW